MKQYDIAIIGAGRRDLRLRLRHTMRAQEALL